MITEDPRSPGSADRTTASGGQRAPRLREILGASGGMCRKAPGMALTTVRYLWHRSYVQHALVDLPGRPGGPDPDRPMPGDQATLLRRSAGHGRTYRRVYAVLVRGSALGPEQLVGQLLQDPNRAVPTEVSEFEPDGVGRAPGDEMAVQMPGPWDAPVRIIERGPTSFRFATLRGHMEAGEIEFRAHREGDDRLRFEIESWSRSGDRLFDALYDKVPLAREMQLHMWVQVCQGVALMSGGQQDGPVQVRTERWRA